MQEQMITFKRADGNECNGYYCEPESGAQAPGIVVIQEWWGVNEQIQGVARRLAEAGYRALVPDLYRGSVTLDMAEAEHMMGNLDFGDAAAQDIRGAVQHLKGSSPRVGVIGYCMGGALSILAAVHVSEADAVVTWYGAPPAEAADTRTIGMPLQGHFAERDEFFPPEQIKELERRLNEGNVNYEFHWYDAKHAFGNETIDNQNPQSTVIEHDPQATQLAWQRTLEFLATHLKR